MPGPTAALGVPVKRVASAGIDLNKEDINAAVLEEPVTSNTSSPISSPILPNHLNGDDNISNDFSPFSFCGT